LAESPSKEVEIMKKFLLALVVLAIASAPALAGPNENGVIVVHNTGIAWSSDLTLPPASPVPAFADPCPGLGTFVNTMELGTTVADEKVWKVYAAFPVANSPKLLGCAWGIGSAPVNAGGVTVLHNGQSRALDFSITTSNWPGDQSFVGMSLDTTHVTTVTELWWFGGYGYAGTNGEPQMWCVIPHNNPLNQFFVDDSTPRILDPIAGYGCLGFGQPGVTPCPEGIVTGACCFADGSCQTLSAPDCVAAGGAFQGGLVACDPNPCHVTYTGACCFPLTGACEVMTEAACGTLGGAYQGNDVACTPDLCPPPTPIETKSWGQIKASYR